MSLTKFANYGFCLAGMILIALIPMLIDLAYTDASGVTGLFVGCGILIFFFVAIIVAVSIQMFNQNIDFVEMTSASVRRLSDFLEQVNEKTFYKLGYEWVMGKDYFWLELHRLDSPKNTKIRVVAESTARLVRDRAFGGSFSGNPQKNLD